jgi:polyether ionophore transport system permease protein
MSTRPTTLAGTGLLTRLALRRDRLMIPLWVLSITLLAVATATSFQQLYPTAASRVPFARSIESNAGLMALTGRGFDLTTVGGLVAWRISGSGALLTAIMSMLLVIRHTRAEEESNRLELLGSGVVGRAAPLAAALLTALTANLAVVVTVFVVLTATGLPAVGSLALGLGFAACGAVFAGVAAIGAQLTETARAGNGITSAGIGAAYLLRAVGDSTQAHWCSWLSPVGWSQQTRAYAGERWWVLVMAVAVAGALTLIGFRTALHRDLGEGVLPTRPGPPRGAPGLRTSFALAWRLQRGPLIGWTAGFAVLGAVFGALADSVTELIDSSPQLRDTLQLLGGRQTVNDAFLAGVFGFGAFAAAAYAVQAVLRLHGEEVGRRAEPLLATPVGRVRWALGHLVISLLGVVVVLAAMGLAAGIARGVRGGDLGGQLPRVLGGALIWTFAIWVFAGLVMALFGLAPRWAPAGWVAVTVGLLIYFIGSLVTLNHWLMDLSPFSHLPKLPGGEVHWAPLIWLTVVSVGLCALGLAALHRRDID